MIIFITTNNIDNLDKALLRPGRIDKKYDFDYADYEQIKSAFKLYRKNESDEDFSNFYSRVKNKKITMAIYQKFFFDIRKLPSKAYEYTTSLFDLIDNYDCFYSKNKDKNKTASLYL